MVLLSITRAPRSGAKVSRRDKSLLHLRSILLSSLDEGKLQGRKTSSLAAILSILLSLTASAANSCVDINTASTEELDKIGHIGPSRAEQVIKLRPFSSIEELTRVKGIGPARIADIKKQGLACVEGETFPRGARVTPLTPIILSRPPSNPPSALLTALAIAIFSGFAILFLKSKR